MKHIIIGTAGHIDHGKTELIKAMTGRNTDRLKEEQERGITIDLGFTWFDMKDGTRCGIIDVPGHEKLIRNMVAGVVGMDLVLMVVAADEGVMPQTREHLDIMELLGIEKAILVLNKCDLVDEEWLDMVEEETREQLKGTIMENAPIARVSAVTGEGIDELEDIILKMVRNDVRERDSRGIPRLPVDRVFSMPGFGTVVTGTLISGSISQNDTVEVYPTGRNVKVRGIQVYEEPADRCEAGQRAGLNLAGIHKDEVRRGCVIAPPGSMRNTSLIDVRLKILKDSARTVTNRERFHLFTGTSELLCRAVLLDKEEIGPGGEGYAQLLLEEETVVRRGDRFVLRFYSPLETIGGGVVLDPDPRKKKRFDSAAIEELERKDSGSLTDVCEINIKGEAGNVIALRDLARDMAHSPEELSPYLEELKCSGTVYELPVRKDIYYWHRDNAVYAARRIREELQKYYELHPYREGIGKAQIRTTYFKDVKQNVFEECLKRLEADGYIGLHGEYVCLPGHEIQRDETYINIEGILTEAFENAGYNMLRFSEVDLKGYDDESAMDILRIMIDEGAAVRIGSDPEMYTMKHFIDAAREKIEEYFLENKVLTITQVRDMLGTSRKCAKPIVEYMDSLKITKKLGAETERVAY